MTACKPTKHSSGARGENEPIMEPGEIIEKMIGWVDVISLKWNNKPMNAIGFIIVYFLLMVWAAPKT